MAHAWTDADIRGAVAEAIEAERERCAKIADMIAINAERRAGCHDNQEAKRAALDKMEAAQLVAASIRNQNER